MVLVTMRLALARLTLTAAAMTAFPVRCELTALEKTDRVAKQTNSPRVVRSGMKRAFSITVLTNNIFSIALDARGFDFGFSRHFSQ